MRPAHIGLLLLIVPLAGCEFLFDTVPIGVELRSGFTDGGCGVRQRHADGGVGCYDPHVSFAHVVAK